MKFTYDPAGRMIRREDQKGDTVTFNHTMAGTITSRDYRTKANSPSGTIADSDTFTFDNLGRMLTAVSGRYTNTVTMTYDSYGRLKDESLTLASQTYTVTRAYDTRSRLTQLTYPNGSIVQRTYTTRSQLHTVKYLGTTVDTRTYDDGGRLGTSTYANAAVVSFAYRNDNLPTSIATTHAGSPNIGTYSYTWDANKNKTGETITSTMSGFGFSTGATGYDDEDRLQTWNRTNGTMNQAWTLSDVGNWDAFTSAGSTWNRTHSNAHEFTGFTGASTGTLAYDVKGNQTSRPSTLSAPALNLDWNFDNQLVGADTNGSAGSLEVTFEYDALGRRVSRSHSSGNVVYVHAGQQVIADYARGTAAASPSYRYVYADYVDEPILRHTGTGTTLPTTGDNALYYHRNQQYSIIGLTNAAGTLVERYSYTAYGTLGIYDASGTVRTTSTYANRYTYTGREYDADLNLYHFRARWYDPATGGFISRDPLGFVDGMSLYRGYFGVRGMDPTGTQWWICPGGNTMWVPPNTAAAVIQSYRDRGCYPAGITDETGKSAPYPTTDGRPAPFPKSPDPVLREYEDDEVKPDKDGNTREFCGGVPKTQSHKNPQFLCCKDKWYDRFTHCCKGGIVEAKKPLHERDFTSFDACHRWCMTGRNGPGISNNKQTRVTQFGGAVVGGYIFFYFIPIPGAGFVGAGCGKVVIDEVMELHCDDICGRPGC